MLSWWIATKVHNLGMQGVPAKLVLRKNSKTWQLHQDNASVHAAHAIVLFGNAHCDPWRSLLSIHGLRWVLAIPENERRLEGKHFQAWEDIKCNAMAALTALPKEVSQECLEKRRIVGLSVRKLEGTTFKMMRTMKLPCDALFLWRGAWSNTFKTCLVYVTFDDSGQLCLGSFSVCRICF